MRTSMAWPGDDVARIALIIAGVALVVVLGVGTGYRHGAQQCAAVTEAGR